MIKLFKQLPNDIQVKSFKLLPDHVTSLSYSKLYYVVDNQLSTRRLTLNELDRALKDMTVTDVAFVEQDEGERVHAVLTDLEDKAKAAAERKKKADDKKKVDEAKKKADAEKKKAADKKKAEPKDDGKDK